LQRVQSYPDGSVKIDVSDNAVTVSSGRIKHKLYTMPVDQYPAVEEPNGEPYRLSAVNLSRILGTVAHALPADAARTTLAGVALVLNGAMKAMATDCHRAAVDVSEYSGRDADIFLSCGGKAPGEFVRHLQKALVGEETIGIIDTGRRLFLETSRGWLSWSAPSERRSPVEHVMSVATNGLERSVTVDRKQMIEAIKSVSLAANEHAGIIVEAKSNELTITAQHADKGDASASLDAETTPHRPILFGVAYRYMLDMLGAAESGRVVLTCGGEQDPVVIRDGERELLVMTMMM
jgi:DNA polymerase-3 subunit beta